MFSEIAVVVSFVVLGKFLYHWTRTLFALFLARPLGLTVNIRKLGKWAIVTGATDGIGKAFALEFASKQLNVVLLGRNEKKLTQCANEIERNFNVETLTIQVDFTKDDGFYQLIREKLANLDVAILVNNVGMCPALPDYFDSMGGGNEMLTEMIRCNVFAATNMTRICLARMLKRKGGVVINVASASALLPTPLVAIYSATKAYTDFLARALALEVAGTGVIVQSLLPFTVQTKMTGNPEKSFFVVDAREFVQSALNTVGILDRSHGCFSHSLQGYYYSTLPEWLSSRLQWQFFTQLRTSLLAQQAQTRVD